MSSLPVELGLLPVPTTSEQHQSEEEVIVTEVADLSLTEAPPPPPSSSSSSSSSNILLQHFSHEHPLILFQVVKEKEESVLCPGCLDDPVVSDGGPIYRCSITECNDEELFILHKPCAELPKKMVSSIHPQHLLELFPSSSPPCRLCDICRGDILGFSYICRPCNFDLHITCAIQPKYEVKIHDGQEEDHSFILLKPTKLFTCDACGVDEEREMVSYLCTSCQFQVHTYKSCSSSSYPLTVKQIYHSHKLILTYSHQLLDFDFSHKSCKICNNKMNSVFCVYYCSPCAYIAHVKCATSKNLRDEYEDQVVAPVETTNEISLLGGEGEGEGEDQKATELQQQHQQQLLKHVSHHHSLILSNDDPKIDELCEGCRWPISVPFYTCPTNDQCNFSLHKHCAELRGKIRHPLHRHPLTLYAEHSRYPVFICVGCAIHCNGFAYSCDKCNQFDICVGCSLFSDTLSHEGHLCPLNIMDSGETKCSACGLNCSTKFTCEECNFDIDLHCASLPKTTMHKCPKPNWGIRPIKLTYNSVEDESDEYYCDICEERRGQNHWFYYCEACDYSCHPRCILGKNLIKFGESYGFKVHHHPLTVVKNVKGHPTGANCHDSCKDSPLIVCTECDICRHLWRSCPGFWRI